MYLNNCGNNGINKTFIIESSSISGGSGSGTTFENEETLKHFKFNPTTNRLESDRSIEVLSGSVITDSLVVSGETINFNDLTVEWGNLSGNVYNQTDLIPLVSDIIVNGNLSYNEFDGILEISSNVIQYYGCSVILKGGIYNTVEIPYMNRNITTGNGNIFIFILDQNDVTVGYHKFLVGTGGDNEGSLQINFDSPINITLPGIYQFVVGVRNYNSTTRNIDIFHKNINSSDGGVWVAYESSNPSLNTNDPSGVDWSTIQKQTYNRIIKTLIYKS